MGQGLRTTVGLKLAILGGTGVVVALAIGIATYISLGSVRSSSDLRARPGRRT